MMRNAEDTVMKQYRQKHEVLTNISEEAYEAIMTGMQQVVDGSASTRQSSRHRDLR